VHPFVDQTVRLVFEKIDQGAAVCASVQAGSWKKWLAAAVVMAQQCSIPLAGSPVVTSGSNQPHYFVSFRVGK
jgi:hypothetical protein